MAAGNCDNSDFFLTPGEKNKWNGRVEDGVLMNDRLQIGIQK